MIEMPLFNDKKWYLEQVKKAMTDGRWADESKVNNAYEKKCIELSELLKDTISENDFFASHEVETLFEKLVLASYEELQNIYNKIKDNADDIFLTQKSDDKGVLQLVRKKEWNYIYGLYDKLINNGFNIELLQKYAIKSCPYCNENYIINRKRKNGKSYATAQMDHFFPREKFPIFAISQSNLVPCCSACNHIKMTQAIGISPHNHQYNFSHMKISYIPTSSDWIDNPENIQIHFVYDEKDSEFRSGMEQNLETMGIKSSYNTHTDYVQELLKKAQIYGKETRKNLMNDFPQLFSSEEELLRTIFGNYIGPDELLKRPLSKLTQDLLRELEIIK